MTTRSLIAARLHPRPTAGPLTAATIGTGTVVIASTMSTASAMIRSRSNGPSLIRRSRSRSPPPEKARPAPVSTIALTRSSAARRGHTVASAPCSASSVALSAAGRFSVTRATPSSTDTRSTSPSTVVPSPIGAHPVLHRGHDRRGVLPVRDAVGGLGDGKAVVVHLCPVRVVQLVQREAGVERVVEAHVVDALIDRLLDEQRGHRRHRRDPPGQLHGAVPQLLRRVHLRHHAELVRLFD